MEIIVMAIGLFLLVEGFIPFVSPKIWRKMVASIAKQTDRALHITGLICMLIGLTFVLIAHHFL